MHTRVVLLGVLGVLGVLAGCGGGGGGSSGGGGSEQMQLSPPPVAGEDGVVENDRDVRTDGLLPRVGDLGAERPTRESRQFFSFDLSSVPAGWIVTSAVLRLDQRVVVGSPYSSLGSVVVDHLIYGSLDADDFAVRSLHTGLGPLANGPEPRAYSLDVTTAVAQDVGLGRARSQFRLRFSGAGNDGDFFNDFAAFAEAEAAVTGDGQPPALVVLLRRAP